MTNGREHLRELYDLVGRERLTSTFTAEDAAEILPSYFSTVGAGQAYVDSLILLQDAQIPPVIGPIRVRRLPTVFVAQK